MKAFPHDIHQVAPYEPGMDLRDYFAKKNSINPLRDSLAQSEYALLRLLFFVV